MLRFKLFLSFVKVRFDLIGQASNPMQSLPMQNPGQFELCMFIAISTEIPVILTESTEIPCSAPADAF